MNTTVQIGCWIGDSINGQDVHVRYSMSSPGKGGGWVWGTDVATGHDPNPNVGFCS